MLKRILLALLLLPALAFAETFVEGQDFTLIKNSQPSKAQTVQVQEFFSFGCPWCYKVEPAVEKWLQQQGNNVQFSRVPVIFNKDWVYYAKAYYTAELLGLNQKIDPLLFKAIQTDKQNLTNNQSMIDFFIKQGVDKETAESAFTNSTTIDLKINESNALMAKDQINGVPAFVVDQHYKTDLKMAKGPERLLEVLDFLVKKSRKD